MNTSKINKKILLLFILLQVTFNSNLTYASEYLKKIESTIKIPEEIIFNSKDDPLILKFNNNSPFKGYIINFWATWCVPCRKELPDLNYLKLKLKRYNITVYTISIDKRKTKEQLKFLKENGALNLDHYFDKKMNLFQALKLRGVPSTILVNQKGIVISKYEGILKWSDDEIISEIKNLFY